MSFGASPMGQSPFGQSPAMNTGAAFGQNTSAFGQQSQQAPTNPNQDGVIQARGQNNPPTDGVSAMSFSPTARFHLLCTSWDGTARVYDIKDKNQNSQICELKHEKPVLCGEWHHSGSALFTGSSDMQARMWDPAKEQSQQVAQHTAPIVATRWMEGGNVLLTASWDKKVSFWDTRQASPVQSIEFNERVYAVDVNFPMLVVATSDRNLHVYDLNNSQRPLQSVQSPLKYQTRCLSAFPDQKGYLAGSIEGRVAVQHINDTNANFTFKCHRSSGAQAGVGAAASSSSSNLPQVHQVNAIEFHRTKGTFATAGSDGGVVFWDKDSRQKLKTLEKVHTSVSSIAYSPQDTGVFAYAASYDWHKGCQFASSEENSRHSIFIRALGQEETEPKPKSNAGGRR